MVYRDRSGKLIRESTFTEDWQEAQRKLRERLQARDDKILDVVRKGEQLQFSDWADFSWRTTPNRRSGPRRPTKRTSVGACISRKRSGNGPSETSLWMKSSCICESDYKLGFRSGYLGALKEIGSSRQPSIRNCGFFAV